MVDMSGALVIYVVFCLSIGLMLLETIDFRRWRWSIADLLKITLVAGVMLALGRLLISN
jgi:hypothetical protein